LKKYLILVGLVFALAVAFFACKKDTVSVQTDKQEQQLSVEDQQIVDYLVSTGYDAKNITVGKDGYTVEGCMYMDRETLVAMMNGAMDSMHVHDGGVEDRQRAVPYPYAVSIAHVGDITYFVHSSVSQCQNPTAWNNAITTAAQKWNEISYCKVNFIPTSQQAGADLIICSDNPTNKSFGLPSDFTNIGGMGMGQIPTWTSGLSGKFISINRSHTGTNRLTCIMHEMGHTLGFTHSNSTDGNHLFGTPQPDGLTSVMHGDLANTSTVFNAWDIRAARLLYPDDVVVPSTFTAQSIPNNPGKVKLTVSASSLSYPPYWLRFQRWNSSGTTMLNEGWIVHDGTEFQVGGIPTGTYKFRVMRTNYRRDKQSSWTSFVTVSIPWEEFEFSCRSTSWKGSTFSYLQAWKPHACFL
jgi:hypothetical protein